MAFLLCFPLIVFLVIGWFLIPFWHGYAKEMVAFFLLTLVCFSLILLVKPLIFKKIVYTLFYLFLALLIAVKLSFYFNYGVKMSSSALFVIFETNPPEASTFILSYMNIYIIFMFVVLLLPVFYIIRKSKTSFSRLKLNHSILKISAVLFIIISLYIINLKFSRENIILMSIDSFSEYQDTRDNLKANLAQPTSEAFQIISKPNEAQVHVVIIGESTSRWHMQLYGYNRETNPKLTEIKDDLFVFDSVITPHVHTILALEKIFTLSSFSNKKPKPNGSILQLANQGGFETFWISNQRPVGFDESIPTILGSAAKNKQFLTTDYYNYDIYDEKVLPALQNALQNKAEKKLIFIHLIGTHIAYKQRYPDEFKYFEGVNPITKIKSKLATKRVNYYDNAVRYNDYIVREIIDKVKANNSNSSVVYFSDHGDDVYDTMNIQGHNEYHGTRPMYEVPFIAWFSDEYKEKNVSFFQDRSITNRRYNLEDFIYTFSDLTGVKFNKSDSTKSIFNNNFKRKIRWVKDSVDYDKR